MKISVLGGGLVGGAIARDLAADHDVTVFDIRESLLSSFSEPIRTQRTDLSRGKNIRNAVKDADLAVGAVPGFMGYATVEAVIGAGRDIVDISFFPEDGSGLHEAAVKNGVRCLLDFGVAPGCSNLICGRSLETFHSIESFICMVGGLPEERRLPWEYQAPFSPSDVLEEYTRPARIIRNGREVTLEPLTEIQPVDFAGVGTLEAFLTDGLRSLLRIEGIPEMVEKTLRYPGYVQKVKLLSDSGFLSPEPLKGKDVSPLELSSALLFEAWKQNPGDRDITVMRVEILGSTSEGKKVKEVWEMLDRYDDATATTSMARTTGYTCTAGVRMLERELWTEPGAFSPEHVGRNGECFDFIMENLRRRGVVFKVGKGEV